MNSDQQASGASAVDPKAVHGQPEAGDPMRVRRYVEAAISRELATLRSTRSGRAAQTFKTACAIGNFVGAGWSSHDEMYEALMDAAAHTGLEHGRAHSAIVRGLRIGAQTPRDVPAPRAIGRVAIHTQHTVQPTHYEPERRLMDRQDAIAFWNACTSVADDSEAGAILAERRLDPEQVATWDLARAHPDQPSPRWAWCKGQTWAESGHRLIIPMYDEIGALRGFSGRCRRGTSGRKALLPTGFSSRGLLFACPLARQMLGSASKPEWWGDEAFVLTVLEGGPNFLAVASRVSECNEGEPATIGITSGSWTSNHAARVPDGTVVVLVPDPGETGRRYMLRIGESLHPRCDVRVQELPR